MGDFIDSLTQILMDWGYFGLFFSSFIAGTVLPFASEVVLFGLLKLGLMPWLLLLSASLGNTLGGMTCYYVGHLGKIEWVEKYFHIKKERVDRMQVFLQGKGAMMAFFSFVPGIGTVICVALGFMRSNKTLTTTSMFVGKFLRYVVIWLLAQNI